MDYKTLYKQIQTAIEIEEKHQWVNVIGKKTSFSKFIISCLNKISKNVPKFEREKLKNIYLFFEQYPFDSPSGRENSVVKLIEALKYYKRIFKKREQAELPKTTWQEEIDKIDVKFVQGVGPKAASLFKKINIETVADLLEYYPRKYLDYEGKTKIKYLKEGENVSIFGTIRKVSAFTTSKKLIVLTVTIGDSSGHIDLTYFYKAASRRMLERYKSQFPIGAGVIALGKVKFDSYKNCLTLDKPELQILNCDFNEEEESVSSDGQIVPIYPLTENLSPKLLTKAIKNAIMTYQDKIVEPLPQDLIKKHNFLSKKESTKLIHLPKTQEDISKAKRRLVYEELFIMQLNFALIRERNKKTYKATPLKIKKGGLVEKFIESLPFELTNAQKKAVDEILADLKSKEPMQRLLQGDVGSGKTVVACIYLLCAIENGYQGAIMAPTEILATQHYKNFVEWLCPLNISIGLFLGKNSAKERREALRNLKNGQTHIAVGTHALIQEGVEFNNLGAVVIDEQHRFGVKQRASLGKKGESAQILTMTATPIPRTLALSVHGDLDLTTIDEMPKGRLPIKTTLLMGSGRRGAYDSIKEEILKGHQAYIIYPLIDESETISAKNATQEHKRLSETVFQSYKVGLLHGKLDPKEKDQVMLDFKNKKYDILVSTTVVEVGVDVPNATIMIIENAERFGLSQLHQLRGRVGRNSEQSYCILISTSSSQNVQKRLKIMTQTNNGFIIAEKDLELRGPGEFLGTRQSGIQDLGLADIVNDVEILEMAREDAINFVKDNDINDFPSLKNAVTKKDIYDAMRSG